MAGRKAPRFALSSSDSLHVERSYNLFELVRELVKLLLDPCNTLMVLQDGEEFAAVERV
jgi:hypothetical protein